MASTNFQKDAQHISSNKEVKSDNQDAVNNNRDRSCTRSQTAAASSSNETAASTQPVACVMETLDVEEADLLGTEESGEVWARLLPVNNSFTAIDLSRDEYSFGRDNTCDVCFVNMPHLVGSAMFTTLSKTHFVIRRDKEHVLLEDRSSNGTFVNGEKVGKNSKRILIHLDEISLSQATNKAFIFIDSSKNEENGTPKDLQHKYIFSKLLGRGACGEVKLAYEKTSCDQFAVKIVRKKMFTMKGSVNSDAEKQVMNEIKILRTLNHPGLITVYDVVDTDDNIYIFLEYVKGGELFDRVVSAGQFKESVAKLYFYQMLIAVDYLHKNNIVHRDLKPENVLLLTSEEETVIKVTDFGLSKLVTSQSMMQTFCGTPNYLAPEVLATQGCGSYTEAIDCWALGVILFICLAGYPPFTPERTDMSLGDQIRRGSFSFPDNLGWKHVSNQAKDMVTKLLELNPEKRLSVREALEHPWLQDEEVKSKTNKLLYGGNPPEAAPNSSNTMEETTLIAERRKRINQRAADDGEETCIVSPKRSKKVGFKS